MPHLLGQTLAKVRPVDKAPATALQAHLDNLTKPQGSLGRLEEIALRLGLIFGGTPPTDLPAVVFTCAGDHGVAAEGVSPYPSEVTRQMVANFLAGGAGINALSRANGVEVRVVDAGCLGEPFPAHPKFIDRRVRSGSGNLAVEPAMTPDECRAALEAGIEVAAQAAAEGFRCVCLGEMGIANTTPATALYCAYLGLSPTATSGPGAGLSQSKVSHKAKVIEKALALHADVVRSGDPLAVLAALGGLEIACMAGVSLGAAASGICVMVDGFIATSAFLAASRLCPAVTDYAFFAHASAEPGHVKALAGMDVRPLLHLDLRLGEGTGAVMAVPILRSSLSMYHTMATFDSAGVTGTTAP